MTYQKLIVPIDHGNRNLKTENHVFTSGIIESDCICITTADTMHCLTSVSPT